MDEANVNLSLFEIIIDYVKKSYFTINGVILIQYEFMFLVKHLIQIFFVVKFCFILILFLIQKKT